LIAPAAFLFNAFRPYGYAGLLAALFLIFYLDATVFPTLPELFTVLIFMALPTLTFALMMLAVISFSEFFGISTLYTAFRRFKLPDWMRRKLVIYSKFFALKDERVILVNRIAPVIPYLGAFIATCDWPYGRSLWYNFIGGMLKYALIIAMAGFILSFFGNALVSGLFTIVAVLTLIAVSWFLSFKEKRKFENGGMPGA